MSWEIIEHPDLSWPFQYNNHNGYQHNCGGGTTYLDPAPAYPHDRAAVEAAIKIVNKIRLPLMPIKVVLLDYEDIARTNAWANQGHRFTEGGHAAWDCWIVFSGKRIPPHPAMSRHLIAHEYAHHIEDWIALIRDQQDSEVVKEYATLRGLGEQPKYGAGGWHKTWGEVFANDWRILVAGVETEFWPHPGILRPEKIPAIKPWWKKAMVDLEEAYQDRLIIGPAKEKSE